jgi:hypothetical protein
MTATALCRSLSTLYEGDQKKVGEKPEALLKLFGNCVATNMVVPTGFEPVLPT